MSKLSAQELANRGHMFLANGDKRKSAITAEQQQKKEASHTPVGGKFMWLLGFFLKWDRGQVFFPFPRRQVGLGSRLRGRDQGVKCTTFSYSCNIMLVVN